MEPSSVKSRRPSRRIRLLLASAVIIVAATGAIGTWRQRVIARQKALAGPAIEESLKAGDLSGARMGLKRFALSSEREAWEHRIRSAEIDQGLKLRDPDLLLLAIGKDGAPWLDPERGERADLILARHAVQRGDVEGYGQHRESWKESHKFEAQWFLLEADRLIGAKRPDEARQWLASRQFGDRNDAFRLARLALLQAADPAAAWKTIREGLAADPRNGDLLSFQAQLCEALGKPDDARQAYVAAIIAEPGNPLHRDSLANFYRRVGRLPEAIDTWVEASRESGLGVYGFKAWFWSRMSGHVTTLPDCRQIGWSEVIAACSKLAAGPFMTADLESSLRRLPGGMKRPEAEWLGLLEKARRGNLIDGSELSHGARALWPGLAERLVASSAALHGTDPRRAVAGRERLPAITEEHPFIRDFRAWSESGMEAGEQKRFEGFLARPDSPVGVLLASGWPGAALDFGGGASFVTGPGSPEWLVFGYAKALQERDGVPASRKWLEAAGPSGPAAQLLLGELKIADGAVDDGLKLVAQIAAGGDSHAGRASWTLAMAALQRGDATAATAAVKSSPELDGSPRGAEILARAALLASRRDEAAAIYRTILDESPDAGIFLSKEAFAAGHFDEARDLTLKLMERFPEEPTFRRNLAKIDELHPRPQR